MQWTVALLLLCSNDGERSSFFKKSEIDFWRTDREPPSRENPHESIFAEPVRMPDGRYAIYVPPRQVLEFLENPTRESARGYLDWQNARSRKIATGLELIETLKREELRGDPEVQPVAASEEKKKGDIRLTYFRQAG
jgi:hypothetical protein